MQGNSSFRAVFAFTVSGLCVLYMVEWRRSRVSVEQGCASIRRDVSSLRTWIEGEVLEAKSLARAVARDVDSMRRERAVPTATEVADMRASEAITPPPNDVRSAGDESLPPMPVAIQDPVSFVRGLDPQHFFADPTYNPQATELASMEKVKVGCELAIARSRIDILDKEIQVICSKSIDRMRQEGSYVEYEPGQPPDPADVITVGEVTERGSTRVYYFIPEEFEEIYEKKAKQRAVGEDLVRRLLRFAEDGGEGGPSDG